MFRAQDPSRTGNDEVVVKRMLASLAKEPGARAMFEQESRFGALIEHPNVVRLLGAGEEQSLPYLVLEHVAGLDLWRFCRWLTRQGAVLAPELAIYVSGQMLRGLHAVHEAIDEVGRPLGIVHRDVSPSNVLLSDDGDVKLSDLGIARTLLEESRPQGQARAKGKLGYLAPEQVRGHAADRRADVFAAAVMTAELLIGRPFFAGGSELAVLLAIRDADLSVLDAAAGSLPANLVAVLRAALAREPDERTPSAAALAAGLERTLTKPRAALRSELSRMVAEASRVRVSSGTMMAVRPDDDRGEITAPAPELSYRVKTTEGRMVGPLTYAKMVEAVATSQIALDDGISVGGEPFRPLRQLPELVRHLPASSLSERTRNHAVPGTPDREYDAADSGVARALLEVALERASGLLLFEQGSIRKEIYVENGVPCFVASNQPGDLLGEYLVSREVITRGELEMALAVMPRFEGRLGDTLTALGLVESMQLIRHIGAQVEAKLLDLFEWSSGRGQFYRGVARPQSGFPLGLDPWKIILNGVHRRIALGLEAPLDRRVVVAAARPAPRGLAQAQLPASCRAKLDRAIAPLPLAELARVADDPRDPAHSERELLLLFLMGALRVHEA